MSHIWHKSMVLAASAAAVVGMMSVSAAGAATVHHSAVHHTGKTLIVSDYQFIDSLNPFQATTVFDTEVTGLTDPGGNLATFEPNGSFKWLEATTPKSNKAGTVWTFSLKKGLKWSNGDPVSNKDYLYSWHVSMNPNTGAGNGVCTGSCDNISSIKLNKNGYGITVTVKKAGPTVQFLSLAAFTLLDHNWSLSNDVYPIGVTKKNLAACLKSIAGCNLIAKGLEDKNMNYSDKSFVTGGPFQVSSWDPTSGIVDLVPNKHYTSAMPGGAPKVSQVKYIPFGSGASGTGPLIAAAAAGGANGGADVTEDYTLADVGKASNNGTLAYYANKGDFTLYQGANANPEIFFFNTFNTTTTIHTAAGNIGPVTNPFAGANGQLVRDAFALSWDRSEEIQSVFGVDQSTADGLVSYCAPIACPNSGAVKFQVPHGQGPQTGQWDIIANSYVPGHCASDGANNTADQDALTLLNNAGYNSGHPLTVYFAATTKSIRTSELAYLQSCWENLASWITVNTYREGSGTLYGPYYDSQTPPQPFGWYANGWYEMGIVGYAANTPDPSGWEGNTLGKDCTQDGSHAPTQENWSCFHDSTVDSNLIAADSAAKASTRQADYNAVVTEFNKQAYWQVLYLSENIWTYDSRCVGCQGSPWQSSDTWNSFLWS